MATEPVLPVRVRVNVAHTTTGKVSYEATVELVMPLGSPRTAAALLRRMEGHVLEASDRLEAELGRRYGVDNTRGT